MASAAFSNSKKKRGEEEFFYPSYSCLALREIMHNLNKNNTIVTAAKVFSLAAILVVALAGISTMAPLTALASRSRGGAGK